MDAEYGVEYAWLGLVSLVIVLGIALFFHWRDAKKAADKVKGDLTGTVKKARDRLE